MVSFGSGGSKKEKSSGVSGTKFRKRFFDQAYDYFGGDPGFDPQYTGFDDFDKLEENLYGSQQAKLSQARDSAQRNLDERLSLSGLLTSPNQYIRGGASQALNEDYLTNLQQAARDSSLARLGLEQGEAERRTNWDSARAMAIMNKFLSQLGLAISAGRFSRNQSSGSADGGFNFGVKNPFAPIEL